MQARIVTVSDRFDGWAREVQERLAAAGWRVELDESSDKLGAKIRNAQLAKIPFSLVIGEKEVEAKGVAPRRHGGEDLKTMPLDAFEALLRREATPPYYSVTSVRPPRAAPPLVLRSGSRRALLAPLVVSPVDSTPRVRARCFARASRLGSVARSPDETQDRGAPQCVPLDRRARG